MTLSYIRTQILSHFTNEDMFLLSDCNKIKTEKVFEKSKINLVTEAMKDLEDSKIVKKVKNDEGIDMGWILENKLGAHGQDVYISFPIAVAVSQTINSFIDANGLKEEKSNALNISERDIVAMIQIINDILDNEEKQ